MWGLGLTTYFLWFLVKFHSQKRLCNDKKIVPIIDIMAADSFSASRYKFFHKKKKLNFYSKM